MIMNSWNAFCVFVSILYLSGSLLKAALCFVFVIISGALGFGSRWLARLGFLVSLVALAVFLGAPGPARWSEFIDGLPRFVEHLVAWWREVPHGR